MDYDFTDISDEDHNYVTKVSRHEPTSESRDSNENFQGDIVCLSCVASHNRDGVLGSERYS